MLYKNYATAESSLEEKHINQGILADHMDIDKDLLRRVGAVARLDLTEEELDEFMPQFQEVFDAFSEVAKVDTEGVPPSFQPVKLRNSMREDKVEGSLSQADALKNAEHKKDGYFMGPKAV